LADGQGQGLREAARPGVSHRRAAGKSPARRSRSAARPRLRGREPGGDPAKSQATSDRGSDAGTGTDSGRPFP
jgi:hypothetical protein